MNRGKMCKAISSSVGEKIEAKIAKLINSFYKISVPFIVALMLLTSCAPGVILEVNPTLTQATEIPAGIIEPTISPTPEASNTPENTATITATIPPTHTATPEKIEAENMHEYCIQKAKEVGIDLNNLANSNNLWLTEIKGLEDFQEAFDTSFNDDRIFKTMIVVGFDSLNSQTRYDQAPSTDANKKIMSWLEAVYKNANGQYQMVLLPTEIWDIEQKTMWVKQTIFGGAQYFGDPYNQGEFNAIIKDNNSPDYNPDLDNESLFIGNYAKQGYWMGPGAFISFDSDYPDSEAGGAGTLETPSFSKEQMSEFQNTGKADFFPNFIIDSYTGIKKPIIYPFINYATLSKVENYQNQAFIKEYVAWFAGDNRQWLNPNGPPYPRAWQAIP